QLTASFADSRSIVGDWLTTVTVSSTDASSSLPLIVIVAPALRLTDEMLSVRKPESVNVTVYVPAGSSGKRYKPWSSVFTVRAPPIICGLAIETSTPGSAPLLSSTARPVIVPVDCCPTAGGADARSRAVAASATTEVRIPLIPSAFQKNSCKGAEYTAFLRTRHQNVMRPPRRTRRPMTIAEGRPSEDPMVVTALVTALSLNTLKRSTVGSNRALPALKLGATRRSTRFTHG